MSGSIMIRTCRGSIMIRFPSQHSAIAEAAVVGYPHEIKGEGIFCYVIMKEGREETDSKWNAQKFIVMLLIIIQ